MIFYLFQCFRNREKFSVFVIPFYKITMNKEVTNVKFWDQLGCTDGILISKQPNSRIEFILWNNYDLWRVHLKNTMFFVFSAYTVNAIHGMRMGCMVAIVSKINKFASNAYTPKLITILDLHLMVFFFCSA